MDDIILLSITYHSPFTRILFRTETEICNRRGQGEGTAKLMPMLCTVVGAVAFDRVK